DPGFASAMLRLLAGLPGARKGLIGPWSHRYPHFGLPGPAIGFLQEALRWLDHWLKGADTGVMNEPMLRVFMPETSTVGETPEDVPGRWVTEPAWPSPRIAMRELATNPGRLAEVGGPDVPLPLASPQNTGEAAGEWMPIFTTGPNPELAGDQRPDDARSLCFGPITPANRYYAQDIPLRESDPEKAKVHLKKAGHTALKLDLAAADAAFSGAVDTAVLFKEHAAKAGIDVNVVREPNDGYWSRVWTPKPFVMCFWAGRPTEDWM